MICDVCFVDFGGIIDRHYLKFLSKVVIHILISFVLTIILNKKKLQSNRKIISISNFIISISIDRIHHNIILNLFSPCKLTTI